MQANNHWSSEQIKALTVGGPIVYLGKLAAIDAILTQGINYRGNESKVIRIRHAEDATVTTTVEAGERIEFVRPAPAAE